MQKIYNRLLKIIFYVRYLWLKENHHVFYLKELDMKYELLDVLEYLKYSFRSNSFTDGQWLKYLPWDENKTRQDWNTYGIFKQQYGKFYFKARLDGLVQGKNELQGTYVPAIWLYESKSLTDVMKGLADHPYCYEIDIELLRNDLSYTIHVNHTGGQGHEHKGYHAVHSKFANFKLYRNLQKDYHLFMIDWSEKWIKMYINGILTAKFRNEIHIPMQIIVTKCSMTKTIIQK